MYKYSVQEIVKKEQKCTNVYKNVQKCMHKIYTRNVKKIHKTYKNVQKKCKSLEENKLCVSFFRGKKAQPDNFEGLAAGKLVKVSDPIGLTLEGLQEWHDEACMAVLNNRFNDGVKWHDVACHMRSKLVCEDSDALIQRALRENPGHVIPEPVPVKN